MKSLKDWPIKNRNHKTYKSYKKNNKNNTYNTPFLLCTQIMNKICGLAAKPLNTRPIGYLCLPLVKYDKALELQAHLVARRHQITQGTLLTDAPADIVCLLEHPPTFTAGRRIRDKKTEKEQEDRLKQLGADYFETMRGGQITFHGPGQLIAYPILDIRDYQVKKCFPMYRKRTTRGKTFNIF